MCYNKKSSIIAFLTGIISSIILMVFGDNRYKKENIGIGILFIFVSFMQLIDFFIWSDLNCKNGMNKLAGYLGPIVLSLQIFTLFFIVLFSVSDLKIKIIVFSVNLLFTIYLINFYISYISKNDNVCSKYDNCRTKWVWINDKQKYFVNVYLFMIIFNTVFLFTEKYYIIFSLLVCISILISLFNYRKHAGEFWCYFANSVPLILFTLQKLKIL
jgi:hypothetical protein